MQLGIVVADQSLRVDASAHRPRQRETVEYTQQRRRDECALAGSSIADVAALYDVSFQL